MSGATLMAQSPGEWGPTVERLGLPTAILLVVIAGVAYGLKKVIPYVQGRLTLADSVLQDSVKKAEAATERAEARIERADQMRETVLRDISGAMQEQARLLREIRDDVRPRRR